MYDSNLYSTYSDSINSDLSLGKGSYLSVYTKENLDLFNNIKNKITALNKPISVNIKGIIKSVELCNQHSSCKFGLIILLSDIVYNP